MTTRSTVLVAGRLETGGSQVVYTTPPGLVALVKSIYLTRAGTDIATVIVQANRPGVALVTLFESTAVTRVVVSADQIWHVLEPGDQIVVSVTVGQAYVWVNGALLPLGST